MKAFKSIIIGALVALIGSSVWALDSSVTIAELNKAQDVTSEQDVSRNTHSNWQVDSNTGDWSIATVTMKTSSSTSTKRPTVTVTGRRKGTTTFTIRYGSSGSTWNLTVKVEPAEPKAYDYKGYTIAAFGAEQVAVSGDDLVLRFTESGTMNVPADLLADILVVGGGGGGGAGRKGNSTQYYGSGGNGGEVKYDNQEYSLAAKTYVVSVGDGGAGGTGQYDNGKNGSPSSVTADGFVGITANGGSGGTSSQSNTNKKNGTGASGSQDGLKIDITDSQVEYGRGGSYSTTSDPETIPSFTGNGGNGGKSPSTRNTTGAGQKGGSGVVIVRFTGVVKPRTPIAVPTAATGLVWGMTNQTGVAAGEGYVRGGTCEASAIGEYAATVTPDDDHCWPDLTRDTKTIKWSIARRPATVTVLPATKAPNADEPYFHTKNEGFLAADQAELVWTAWRTNTDEAVGTYDVVILGEKEQSGYDITYVGNTLTIENAPVGPSIPEDEGEITYDPETKVVVVTPKDETVTEVEIIDMPADGTVKVPVSVGTIKGVEAGQVVEVFYTAPAGAGGKTYDITPAFTISGDKGSGVTIELNETASVMFDLGDGRTETITVTPTLTETGDETVEPLEVLTEAVDVGVKTIPGLTYALKRGDEPGTVSEGKVVNEKQAEGLRTKLTDPMDGGKPEKAFYVIEVKK